MVPCSTCNARLAIPPMKSSSFLWNNQAIVCRGSATLYCSVFLNGQWFRRGVFFFCHTFMEKPWWPAPPCAFLRFMRSFSSIPGHRIRQAIHGKLWRWTVTLWCLIWSLTPPSSKILFSVHSMHIKTTKTVGVELTAPSLTLFAQYALVSNPKASHGLKSSLALRFSSDLIQSACFLCPFSRSLQEGQSPYELLLQVVGETLCLHYQTALFTAEFVADLLQQYLLLLEQFRLLHWFF